jgi:prevent-host-death family protein
MFVRCVMAKKPTQSITISVFKATCLAVLERVRLTRTPIVVTKRGVPIAEVFPPSLEHVGGEWLGAMKGTATITGDLVAPLADAGEWDALGE